MSVYFQDLMHILQQLIHTLYIINPTFSRIILAYCFRNYYVDIKFLIVFLLKRLVRLNCVFLNYFHKQTYL